MIISLQNDKGFSAAKNIGWIFVQNPMQMDMVEYKFLHMTFELIKIQVIKHLETVFKLDNDIALSCSDWINYSRNLPLFTCNLLHLITLGGNKVVQCNLRNK